MTLVWVIGSGGHAKVVVDTLRASGGFRVVGLLDDDPARHDAEMLGLRVVGDASPESVTRLAVTHAAIAVGSNRDRAVIAARLAGRVAWAVAIHPKAHVAPGVPIGEGTTIFAGAIVQPGARVGAQVILNTSSSVDHDCTVGDFAHLAPGVHLGGDVSIGEGAFLGIGTSVRPGAIVGGWTTIGMGSVVTRDIPSKVIAFGVPAIIISDSSPED